MKPGVIINVQWNDGNPSGPSVTGIRILESGAQEEMVVPEMLMIFARMIDMAMATQVEATKAQQGPKIQLARGPWPA